MILVFLHAFTAAAWAGCAPDDVQAAVQDGLLAFASMDESGVKDAVGVVDAKVACQSAPLTPAQAAQVHQIHGLAAFLNGDTAGAKAAFSAERAIEPSSTLPTKIAPEGGKLARLYADSTDADDDKEELGAASEYRAYVDGSDTSRRPTARPAVIQLSSHETVKYSAWLAADSPLPDQYQRSASASHVADTPAAAPTREAPTHASSSERVSKPTGKGPGMYIAAGAAAVVAGGLLTTAVVTEGGFKTNPTYLDYTLNHVGFWGSIGTGAVAVGLLTVAVVGSF